MLWNLFRGFGYIFGGGLEGMNAALWEDDCPPDWDQCSP